MGRHPAVHRGDDVRATGLQAPVGAIGQPLGIGLPGDERRENRPATDAQDVGDHACQLHVRVFQRLLQALRVPRDRRGPIACGSASGRAAPESGPACTKLPRINPCANRSAIQAASFRSLLRPVNVADVLRVGEHQRERGFVFEDVPHRLPVHAGRLHRHVRGARLGQPSRQFERDPPSCVANSRCSVVTWSDPPRCARRHSRTESGHPARRTGDARLPSVTS